MAKGTVYETNRTRNRQYPWEYSGFSQFDLLDQQRARQGFEKKPVKHIPVRKIFGEVI